MSDPNFWTPPGSPKFGGDRLDVLDDVGGDLFTETEAAFGGIFTSPKIIGLVCGHLNRNDFLESFERPLDKSVPIDPFVCLGELWSRFLVLINDIVPRSDFSIETVRNDISILLSSALHLLSCTSTDSSLVPAIVTRLRSLLVNVGRLEFKRSKVVRDDLPSLVNELFSLDATSVLDAYGYFVDVVFLYCSCIDFLWTLVIRYSEKVGSLFKIVSRSYSQTFHFTAEIFPLPFCV
ncbi:hypothetical protein EG68_12275 [Paragonimus skrjabini miyazakii]|uniref:Uncharacterized protein n=1 Tax=Paragonimus skrjabini miyazakii TaxID=59628 RepID=A0A8S9YHX9_9TREM|nr:hypothetical protein EG68_12275 [Paragonimus skrjabini miyazakii]